MTDERVVLTKAASPRGTNGKHGPQGGENAARGLITFTRSDLIAPTPLQPLIDGVLYRDTVVGLVGASGSCKSFVAQGMAACIATNTPWQGYNVAQGAVFYLAGEGQSGLYKRLQGWDKFTGVSRDQAPFFIANRLPTLCDSLNVAGVIESISTIAEELFYRAGSCEPQLVVVDTLARAMSGSDENSAKDMGQLIDGLSWMRDSWRCCVLVVHHTGHGADTKARARGSSSYYAGLDGELLVQADGERVKLTSTKTKDWPLMAPLVLQRNLVEVMVEGKPDTTLALSRAPGITTFEIELELQEEVHQRRQRNPPMPILTIAKELGITKGKVEHLMRKIEKEKTNSNDE